MLEYCKPQKSKGKQKADDNNEAEASDEERREQDSSDDDQDIDVAEMLVFHNTLTSWILFKKGSFTLYHLVNRSKI